MIRPMPSRVVEITSRQNPWVRRFRQALDRHRDEIVIEGPRFVDDAIRSGIRPIAIAIRAEGGPLPSGDVTVLRVGSRLFGEFSDAVTSQGVSGLFHRPESDLTSLRGVEGPIVVLDGVQDPGNVGTIVRLAAAFDAGAVVATGGTADPWGPRALRASAGAALTVPLITAAAPEVIDALARLTVPVFYADMEGDDRATLPRSSALVLGSEGQGVSALFREAGKPISIATSGRVESLNVGSAAAILLSRSWQAR